MDRKGKRSSRGGRATPVNEQAQQLRLFEATAENSEPRGKEVKRAAGSDLSGQKARLAPEVIEHERKAVSAITMERVLSYLEPAFENVASNKGAPGPDGQTIEELRAQLDQSLATLSAQLLDGTYKPGLTRRVNIPKAGGGQRGLGIPNVIDRVVSEAIRLVLMPVYDPTFHDSSHGFRPQRSCHTAIDEAVEHMRAGHHWVVDLDLKKFFDHVCHQRLLARLSLKIEDKRLMKVLKRLLKGQVVMPDGVAMNVEEGVPQGGPLSPLLSNIVLDELDGELDQRGHRFVRYADDINIFVRSERAGQRVMASITRFIEKRMRLKVNREKSAVARPRDRRFLGFTLKWKERKEDVEVRISKRSLERFKQRTVELTPRNWGQSFKKCIEGVNAYLRGWLDYYGICSVFDVRKLKLLEGQLRRRLRALKLKQWKCKRTIARKLIQLGAGRYATWRRIYQGRRGLWSLSRDYMVNMGLSNDYLHKKCGLVHLEDLWKTVQARVMAPKQLMLWG